LKTEQVIQQALKKGLKSCKSNIWLLLRNPVYCGRIYVAGYKDESPKHVPGYHEPLISEILFYKVQDILDGKKQLYRTTVGSHEILQLRGYLICPKCGKLLTGSASTGRANQKYYYYHCNAKCGVRFKAGPANKLFSAELKNLLPRPGMTEVYKLVLQQELRAKSRGQKEDSKKVQEELQKANTELANARRLLLTGEIEPSEYKTIKAEYEKKIERLDCTLFELSKQSDNIDDLLKRAVQSLSQMDKLYENSNNEVKRQIIGSIFPEKMVFDGRSYRTTRINEVVRLIWAMGAGFGENKNGKTDQKIDLSSLVTRPGFEPRHSDPESDVLPLYYRALGLQI
jgi:site-specific DNA recombinase